MLSICRFTVSSHALPIQLRAGIFLSTTLMHIQPTSQKAPVNNLNNPILLLRCHLIVAWQAQPSSEDIGTDVDSGPCYVCVGPASAVPLDRDKRIRPVYRLHMHGLPDRASFCLESNNGFQNFLGRPSENL